jgi:hypothetical protein
LQRTRKKPRRSGAFCLATNLPEERLALTLLRLALLRAALLAALTRLLLLLLAWTRIAALLARLLILAGLLVRVVLVLIGHLSLLE